MRKERVLILRPDNIGDVVLFSGALKHLRALYSTAHLTLAVQSHILNLVELCPYVDSCVSVDRLSWWPRVNNIGMPFPRLFEWFIRRGNGAWNTIFGVFDTILYPVKSPQISHLKIVRDLRARRTIGMTGCNVNAPVGGYPFTVQPANLFTEQIDMEESYPWRHELLTTFDFLKFLGCPVSSLREIQPQLWLNETEVDYLAEFRNGTNKIIGLFPGASSLMRCWDPTNYGEFARLMGQDILYVIFGSVLDKNLSSQVESVIRASAKCKIINLVGRTSIRELAKSITSCDLFIGMDSSGLHLAIAQGVPTVGIIGGGHYGRFVPWGRRGGNLFITRQLDCFYCNWKCSKSRVECIQDVESKKVAEAARHLLDAGKCI